MALAGVSQSEIIRIISTASAINFDLKPGSTDNTIRVVQRFELPCSRRRFAAVNECVHGRGPKREHLAKSIDVGPNPAPKWAVFQDFSGPVE